MTLLIEKIRDLPSDCLAEMIRESTDTGFKAVQRLFDEWVSGENRFARCGEALFIAQQEGRLLGICGLNIDPYATLPATGRVRRLYVMNSHRRRGIGRTLVKQVVSEASLTFERLHVRTYNNVADMFYRSIGFVPHQGSEYCTHTLALRYIC